MSATWELLRALPVAAVSALAFYALVGACLFAPTFRARFLGLVSMPAPSTRHYLAPLDIYRGLAAFLVALAHSWQFTYPVFASTQAEWAPAIAYAAKAVPIFTVLSGFLIYRSVKRLVSLEGLRDYAIRRFRRVYPVYLLTVILCIAIGQTPWRLEHIVGEVFALKTFNFPWFTNRPAWSLYIEILFYLVLPVLTLLAGRRILIAACLTFIVFVLSDPLASDIVADASTRLEFYIYMHGFKLWKYFAAGVIAAELFDRLEGRVPEWGSIVLFAMGMALLVLDFRGPQGDWVGRSGLVPVDPAGYTVGIAMALILIILGSSLSTNVSTFWARITPLRVLGVVSYSLFLLHPIYLWANFPFLDFYRMHLPTEAMNAYPRAPAWFLPFVIMPGEVLWAIVSFVAVERWFLFHKRSPA